MMIIPTGPNLFEAKSNSINESRDAMQLRCSKEAIGYKEEARKLYAHKG
jgi:hypothetical protein